MRHADIFECEHEFRKRSDGIVDLRLKITRVLQKHEFIALESWFEFADDDESYVEVYVGGQAKELPDIGSLRPGLAFIVRDVNQSKDILEAALQALADLCVVEEPKPEPRAAETSKPVEAPADSTAAAPSSPSRWSTIHGIANSILGASLLLYFAADLVEAAALGFTGILVLERLRACRK